jgi:hypothetical protein
LIFLGRFIGPLMATVHSQGAHPTGHEGKAECASPLGKFTNQDRVNLQV